jgi:hypothetical protein
MDVGARLIAVSSLAFCIASGMPACAVPASLDNKIESVEVDGTAFRVSLAGGTVLEGRELEGATLSVALLADVEPQRILLARITADPTDPQGEVLLYNMKLVDPETGIARPLCGRDANGERWAFPLRGQWDRNGQHISDDGFTLTCAADAQGKCVRFGYKPWKTLTGGASLADYHQACIRMVRADYCGDQGTTRNGMLIDLYDTLGIQRPAQTKGRDGLRFEAAWNTQGAVCVAHARVPEHVTLARLAKTCPRLRGRLGAHACTEARAQAGEYGPILLFNRSR